MESFALQTQAGSTVEVPHIVPPLVLQRSFVFGWLLSVYPRLLPKKTRHVLQTRTTSRFNCPFLLLTSLIALLLYINPHLLLVAISQPAFTQYMSSANHMYQACGWEIPAKWLSKLKKHQAK